jgi:hypothetical protein
LAASSPPAGIAFPLPVPRDVGDGTVVWDLIAGGSFKISSSSTTLCREDDLGKRHEYQIKPCNLWSQLDLA